MPDILFEDRLVAGPGAWPHSLGGGVRIEGSTAQGDIGSEQRPVGGQAGRAVGHADATGVDEAPPAGEAVKWHMSVTADHGPLGDPGEPLREPVDGAVDQDDLLVVAAG